MVFYKNIRDGREIWKIVISEFDCTIFSGNAKIYSYPLLYLLSLIMVTFAH